MFDGLDGHDLYDNDIYNDVDNVGDNSQPIIENDISNKEVTSNKIEENEDDLNEFF